MVNELLRKYAKLVINVGVNVQKNQNLNIKCPIDAKDFCHLLAEEAYIKGARKVNVQWIDDNLTSLLYKYGTDDALADVEDSKVMYFKEMIETGAATITVTSPAPGTYDDINPAKIKIANSAASKKFSFFRAYTAASHTQWCVCAYPNLPWAKQVFPELEDNAAYEKLLDAILTASRVTKDNDPVREWEEHMERLEIHSSKLNEYNFKQLHFKNNLGTDLYVDLAHNHIWAGGKEYSTKGILFAPNIPTEEVFTMPSRTRINGTVASTRPLSYNGRLIKNFILTFKDGKVINHAAEVGYDDLTALLDTDEGSRHLGEVALISNNSPISNMGILFYNTLFDENASCHLALGNAYPMNLVGGTKMSAEELYEHDANISIQHVDFMFGSKDMEVTGITFDGKEVPVFKKGNFVF